MMTKHTYRCVCVCVCFRFSEHRQEQRDQQFEALQGLQCRLHAGCYKVRDYFHLMFLYLATDVSQLSLAIPPW